MDIYLVRTNEMEDARWFANEIKYTFPQFNAERWAIKQPYKNKQIHQQLRDDLPKAGLELPISI